ncbi:MAG: type II secretion system protein [Patescibacteria group bacterium]|jgi:general secretion pathway protein G
MKRQLKNLKGFTLIELLVVIAILGLIAGLVFSNMAGARERARDAKRKSDLKEIQKALQMYKQDHNSQYPSSLDELEPEDPDDQDYYIKVIPSGPLDGEEYSYSRSADLMDFTLYACLENASDPQGIDDSTLCPDSGKKFVLYSP